MNVSAEQHVSLCAMLGDDEHELFCLLSANFNARTHNCRISFDNARARLGWDWPRAAGARDGLVDLGLVAVDDRGNLSIPSGDVCGHALASRSRERADGAVQLEAVSQGRIEVLRTSTLPPPTALSTASWDEPDSEVKARAKRRRRVTTKGTLLTKPAEDWGPTEVVMYFEEQMTRKLWGKSCGPVNRKALRANVSRWFSENGLKGPAAKDMIDRFVAAPTMYLIEGVPAWKCFLANRHMLLGVTLRRQEATEMEQRIAAGESRWSVWVGSDD